MPGRNFSSEKYRYGFNGKEKDKDITAGDLDFGARIYDGRIGRWLSVDPLQSLIPGLSAYVYCYSSPLRFTDPDGRLGIDVVLQMNEKTGKYTVVSVTYDASLKLKVATYEKNHSLVDIRNWHDYMQITYQDSKGQVTGSETVFGDVRTTTDNAFWFPFPNAEKKYAQHKVDDGFLEDRDGIMLMMGGGIGGSPLKTRNGVDIVHIDDLTAAFTGAKAFLGNAMPSSDFELFIELITKTRNLITQAQEPTSEGTINNKLSSVEILMKKLETIVNNETNTTNSSNTTSTSTNVIKPPAQNNPTPRLEPGRQSTRRKLPPLYKRDTVDKIPGTVEGYKGPWRQVRGGHQRDTITDYILRDKK